MLPGRHCGYRCRQGALRASERRGGSPSLVSEAQRPIAIHLLSHHWPKAKEEMHPPGNLEPATNKLIIEKMTGSKGQREISFGNRSRGMAIGNWEDVWERLVLLHSNLPGQTPWWQVSPQQRCPADPRTVQRYVCAKTWANPILVHGSIVSLKGCALTFSTTCN